MPFFGKCENVVLFGKMFNFGITDFFIFCIIIVFSGAIQHAKFEHRSPDKIKKYSALFSKMENSNVVKRYRTRAMTWDGASNCSRQVILEVLSFCYSVYAICV